MQEKRNVLITGGAQGLGKYIVESLYKKYFNIIIIDIKPIDELPKDFRIKISAYYQVDLAMLDEVDRVVRNIIKQFKKIDVLINNASMRIFKDFIDFSEKDISKYLIVNIHSPLIIIKRLLPIMKNNNFGRIINISSISAYNGYSTGSLYCSTKMGLITFAESLSREFKKENNNVTINTICPDSFRKIDGQKLKNDENIIGSVIKSIDKIINSNVNGRVYNAFIIRNRLLSFLLYLKKSMNFMK